MPDIEQSSDDWLRYEGEQPTIDDLPTSSRAAEVRTALNMVDREREEREKLRAEVERLRTAAKRVLEADMRGVRDLDALNALEDAAGFSQQGQRRG